MQPSLLRSLAMQFLYERTQVRGSQQYMQSQDSDIAWFQARLLLLQPKRQQISKNLLRTNRRPLRLRRRLQLSPEEQQERPSEARIANSAVLCAGTTFVDRQLAPFHNPIYGLRAAFLELSACPPLFVVRPQPVQRP